MKIIGKKVLLKTIRAKDLENLRRIRFNTKVVKLFHGINKQTKNGQIKWYKKLKIDNSKIYLTSFKKHNNQILGLLNANIIKINKNAEVGWFFDIEKKENTLFAHSVILFLDYLFKNFDLIKVYSDVLSFNNAALKFNENIGFKIEGETFNHYYYFKKYVNAKHVALYRKDFYQKNKKLLKFLEND